MNLRCPYCRSTQRATSGVLLVHTGSNRLPIVRIGSFFRTSDSRHIQRFRCTLCSRSFSRATVSNAYGQKKRHLNEPLRKLLVSGVSMRRAALLLKIHRTTVSRKLYFLSQKAMIKHEKYLKQYIKRPLVYVQFDEMESFEHTKCKPLSIPLIVEPEKRKLLGFDVGRIPAKGLLAKISREKYGKRINERPEIFKNLFKSVKDIIHEEAKILSDQNPTYPSKLLCHLPGRVHETVKGRRGCIVGQAELKKIGFDPLFSLNHTCAMIRANVNRLIRKTWCTTKKPEALKAHLWIYLDQHNRILTEA